MVTVNYSLLMNVYVSLLWTSIYSVLLGEVLASRSQISMHNYNSTSIIARLWWALCSGAPVKGLEMYTHFLTSHQVLKYQLVSCMPVSLSYILDGVSPLNLWYLTQLTYIFPSNSLNFWRRRTRIFAQTRSDFPHDTAWFSGQCRVEESRQEFCMD